MCDAPGIGAKIVFHGLPDLLQKIGHGRFLLTKVINKQQ
jgi:hypothetical protein